MMRNDDVDEIDLSRHRPSRLPGVLVACAAVGVALTAVWFFTPFLISKGSAVTASLVSPLKARTAAPREQAPALASAQAAPVVPAADPTPDPATAAPAETTASTPWNAQPWPQSRSIQVAIAPATAPLVEPDSAQLAAVAPQDTPAEPADSIPLPRKRPSRLIAASLTVPLPRPRPEIEADAPSGPTAFDLQVERMR